MYAENALSKTKSGRREPLPAVSSYGTATGQALESTVFGPFGNTQQCCCSGKQTDNRKKRKKKYTRQRRLRVKGMKTRQGNSKC